MRRSLFWRILGGYALVVVLVAGTAAVVVPRTLRGHEIDGQSAALSAIASVLRDDVLARLSGPPAALEDFVVAESRTSGVRITVVDASGRVLADSQEDPAAMDSHRYRPELRAALEGRVDREIRWSDTVRARMLFMGFPLRGPDGRAAGALRLGRRMSDLDAVFGGLRAGFLRTLLVIALAGLVAAVLLSRALSRPVHEFVVAAERVAGGDFDVRLAPRRHGELKAFARSFNAMTGELKDLFRDAEERRQELDEVLASIADGICVVDADDRIVITNPAFRRIVRDDEPYGRFHWEVVLSSGFMDLLREARESRSAREGEVVINERVYAGRAAWLPEVERRVVTLHDVTEARALERVKKDFVLNVSHELKTPLTSIKGFAEVLQGSVSGEALRFVDIIRRNTDRLIAIVQDLLALSEVEERGLRLDKEPTDLRSLAETTLRLFEPAAREKGIELRLDADGVGAVPADPFQLERLLVNLVDNAVRYTDKGRVVVSLRTEDGWARIDVSDTGPGIAPEHLPHVFERFYVIDPSRSRKVGGTGLGLSIVKHIALAHRGRVDVSSRVGEGTTFTVRLPRT